MGVKPGYRGDIDGLRAVAVLAVLFFHAGLSFPGGFIGVDVFFVISGYLITRLIVNELDRGSFTFANFWTRRLRRIWPAASVMTICTLAAGALLLDPSGFHQLATDAIAQTAMVANVQFMRGADYFGVAAELRALLHTWSLAVEEQFYLFHPFAVVLIWRWKRQALLPVFIVAGLLSFILSVGALDRYPSATFYMLPTRAWELLMGAALAVWPTRVGLKPASRTLLGLAGLAMVGVPMFVYDRATPFPGLAALPPCLGTALLILIGTDGTTRISRALAWEPMRRIGLISYSLYLVHWPILALMRSLTAPDEPTLVWRVAALPASFLLAYLSYRFVEQRFRHAKRPARVGRVVLGSAAIAAFTIFVSVLIRQSDGWKGRFDESLLAHIDPEPVAKRWQVLETDADDIDALTKPIGMEPSDDGPPSFVLWGDSHGMAISRVLHEQAEAAGLSGIARLRSATTPVPGLWSESGGKDTPNANKRVLDWILENDVAGVILCARWTVEIDGRPTGPHDKRQQTLVRPVGTESATPESAASAMTEHLGRLIETLESNGVAVWVLLEVPRQKNTPQQRAIVAHLTRRDLPTAGVTIEQHREHVANANTAVLAAITERTRVIDLSVPFFRGSASTIADEHAASYYSDDDHVNSIGARALLAAEFESMMREIAGLSRREDPAPP